MKKMTLQDIASEFNTSKNTVSKALRGLPGVSGELRDKILRYAAANGYSNGVLPGVNASLNILLICWKTFFEDETFWSRIFHGIWDYEGDTDIRIKTVTIDKNTCDYNAVLATVAGSGCDGCIVLGDVQDELLQSVTAKDIPLVVVDYYSDNVECDFINSANRQGIGKAVAHLYENNHRRIGFINNRDAAYSFNERYMAFKDCARRWGLETDERFIWPDAVYSQTGYYVQKINQYRNSEAFPTGWVCVNDSTALAFCHALEEVNLKVPEDVSVVGFDNISGFFIPLITTVEVPQKTMGQRAVKQLLYRINNPGEPFENVLLGTKLIKRNSVKML